MFGPFFRVFPAKIPAKRGKPPANRELCLAAGVAFFLTHPGSRIKSQRARRNPRAKAVVREEKCVRFSARFPYFLFVFARTVDLAPDVGFRRSWYRWKACATLFLKVWTCGKLSLGWRDMVPRTEAAEVFSARRRAIFRPRFRLDQGKSWRSESCTSCLNISFLLRLWTCGSHFSELERICVRAQHPRGENYEIFSIVLFHPSVFVRMVDVVLDVGFRRSWCHWKACATFFFKVLGLHRGELGFVRYDPANRGYRSVSQTEGSFFDRDSGLTGEALDDPRVVRCS
jgi:hypothetical protein